MCWTFLSDNPNPPNLDLKEKDNKTVYIKDVTMQVVKQVADINALLARGKIHRKTGETKMNDKSSRSHCIFTVTIEQSTIGPDGKSQIRYERTCRTTRRPARIARSLTLPVLSCRTELVNLIWSIWPVVSVNRRPERRVSV